MEEKENEENHPQNTEITESNNDINDNIKSDESNDISQKQQLIKEKITDAGYDNVLFFNYCMSKKNSKGASDLSNWPIEELTTAINEFIQQEQEKKNNIITTNNSNEFLYSSNNFENSSNYSIRESLPLLLNNNLNEPKKNPEIKKVEITCQKLTPNILYNKEIKIQIKNPQIIETDYFSLNYVLYDIETNIFSENINWAVKRRYKDFVWLREILRKLFPFLFIPPLPDKKIGSKRFENKFISKRMNLLNEFLNNLLLIEEIKNSIAFVAFLSIRDNNLFEAKKKELSIIIPPNNINDIKTFDKKILISCINYDNNDSYFNSIKNYFIIQKNNIQKLNYDLSNFNRLIKNCANALEAIYKDFEILENESIKVQMKAEFTEIYKDLKNIFIQYKNNFNNQQNVISKDIKKYFKYVQKENESVLESLNSREKLYEKVKLEDVNLLNKKEKLWNSRDVTKWEILDDKIDRIELLKDKNLAFERMCTKDNQMLDSLNKYIGYANNKIISSVKKLIEKYGKGSKEYFENFHKELNALVNIKKNEEEK